MDWFDFWPQKLRLYGFITSDVNKARKQKRESSLMFFYLGFLLEVLMIYRAAREGRRTSFFHMHGHSDNY